MVTSLRHYIPFPYASVKSFPNNFWGTSKNHEIQVLLTSELHQHLQFSHLFQHQHFSPPHSVPEYEQDMVAASQFKNIFINKKNVCRQGEKYIY